MGKAYKGRFEKLFDTASSLLEEYSLNPSTRLRNEIAITFYPYVKSYCRQYNFAFGISRLYDLEDAVQECYLTVLRSIELSAPKANKISYLISSVQFGYKKFISKAVKENKRQFNVLGNGLESVNDFLLFKLNKPEVVAPFYEDLRQSILSQIDCLSENQKKVAQSIFVQGRSYPETAINLNLRDDNVKSLVCRARKALHIRLQAYEGVRNYLALPDKKVKALQLKQQGLETKVIRQRLGMRMDELRDFLQSRKEYLPPKKRYVCVSPDGQKYMVENLSAFCREHDLRHQNMCMIARGKDGRKQHKGWSAKQIPG